MYFIVASNAMLWCITISIMIYSRKLTHNLLFYIRRIQHYSTIGDFQTLSLIACMFPYDVPSNPPYVEVERPLQFNLQRSSSNMKLLGTSPATSLTGRSPPEKGYLAVSLYVHEI